MAKGAKPAKAAKAGSASQRPAAAGAKARAAGWKAGWPGGWVAVILVCALVVFQGGYYPGATCAISLVAVVAYVAARGAGAVLGRERQGVSGAVSPGSLCLLAVGCVMLASSLAHGAAVSMLQESATWLALGGATLWCSVRTAREKSGMIDALSVLGVALSAVGIAMFSGILPVVGAVSAGRLMFTFQYANSAGLFFAVIAVLCLCHAERARRLLSVVPIVALALTQSGGALIVFAVALVILYVHWVRADRPDKKVAAGTAVAFVAVAVATGMFLRGRIAQAAQTFVERVIQMLDAGALFAANPLLGIGPDQWQFAYTSVQTAQYRAADVHSSYLQVALDGGVLALVFLLVFVVGGFAMAARHRDVPAAVCLGMMGVHALVDFDFQFAALVALFALIAAEPAGEGGTTGPWGSIGPRARLGLSWFVAACALLASAAGICFDVQSGAVRAASARADAAAVVQRLDETPYLASDMNMRICAVEALFAAGDLSGVVEMTQGQGDVDQGDADQGDAGSGGLHADNENLCLYRAASLVSLGEPEHARDVLGRALHGHPYNVEFFEAVRDYIVQGGYEDELGAMFDEEAAYANGLAGEGRAAWLASQELIEEIRPNEPIQAPAD